MPCCFSDILIVYFSCVKVRTQNLQRTRFGQEGHVLCPLLNEREIICIMHLFANLTEERESLMLVSSCPALHTQRSR